MEKGGHMGGGRGVGITKRDESKKNRGGKRGNRNFV